MIASMHFATDTDELLQRVQQEEYPEAVVAIYEQACSACAAVDQPGEHEALERVRNAEDPDLRVLEEAHDRIAAWYRFQHPQSAQSSLFPPTDESGRVLTHEQVLRQGWRDFFGKELAALMGTDSFGLRVVEAVAFADERRGRNAEEAVLWMLDRRYRSLTRARALWRRRQRGY